MSEVKISAEPRTEFGKGGARRTRRAGLVPAVLYGHGEKPRHIALPAREFAAAIRHGGMSQAFNIEISDGTTALALPKAIQRDPIRDTFDHIDLVIVRRGEKVTVDVPIHVVGETGPDTLVSIELNTVSVQVAATNIPESIEVDVTGRGVGEGFTVADLPLPSGATLLTDAEALVVNLMGAPSAEALEADLEQAEAEAGIEREESDAAVDGAGEGDVVPEPSAQGSGESMDAAEKSADS